MSPSRLTHVSALVAITNPIAARSVKDFLRSKEAFVRDAEGSREAAQWLDTEMFNFIVVDDAFPPGGGVDFVRQLRTNEGPSSYARVLFAIAQAERKLILDARAAGVDRIIALPLSLATLEKSVSEMMQDSRSFVRTRNYVGPDRRQKQAPPPSGRDRRIRQEGMVDKAIVDRSRKLAAKRD